MAKWVKRYSRRVQLAINRLRFEEILVLGDSHARVFHSRKLQRALRYHFFNVYNVGGATASGLTNPMSKTQAYTIYREALRETPASKVLLLLGEVDSGYLIWYRAQKYGEPVEVIFEQAITTYREFVEEVIGDGFEVTCLSAALPTIPDDVPRGDVAKARAEVVTRLSRRTALTLDFNRRVSGFCQQLGASYIDLDPESCGEDGLVERALLNEDPSDHHYHRPSYAELLLPHLQRAYEP